MSPERDISNISCLKQVDPRRDLNEIAAAGDPLAQLRLISEKVPYFLSYAESVSLHNGLSGDCETKRESLLRLSWYCLPQLSEVLEEVQGLGIDNQELFQLGFVVLREEILNWEPVEGEPAQQDCLRFFVVRDLERKMKAFVAGEYRLAARRFPLVKLYFSVREQFAEFCGREARLEDFGELEWLATQELAEMEGDREESIKSLRYFGVRPKRGGEPRRVDLLHKVHQICCEDYREPIESKDPLGEIEEQVATGELKESLGSRVFPILDAKEARVLEYLYGLNEQSKLTLKEVGKILGVSYERVRQIEAKALRKLRNPSQSYQFRDFL